MKYFKESIFAITAALLVACSADNDSTGDTQTLPAKPMTFTASLGDAKDTRTTLSNDATNPYPVWASNDQIKVLNTTTSSTALFDIAPENVGQRTGSFTGSIKVDNENANSYYALYANSFDGDNAPTITSVGDKVTVSGTIPDVQTEKDFHANYHFMTACTTGTAFRFKNAMSILKFVVTENDYETFKLCKVYIKSNSGAFIAGNFTADFKADGDGILENYQISNGRSMITICDGTKPIEVGTYYIAVLPFTGGFTLKIEDERDGNLKEYQRVSTKDVAASKEINLGSYSARAVAKEAYVDLGLTSGTKWCIENVYDEAGENISVPTGVDERETVETSPSSSYYAWGETYVKSNQYKVDKCNNYSWYYTYGIGTGSNGTSDDSEKDLSKNSQKRSYKFGIGKGGLGDYITSTQNGGYVPRRLNFDKSNDGDGVLLKYNDTDEYISGGADWGGGVNDQGRILDLADDAVNKKATLSKSVRIPVATQFDELFDETTVTLSSDNKSYIFKSRNNGRFITLPIGGYKQIKSVDSYWQNDGFLGAPALHYKFGQQDWELTTACYWTRHRTYYDEEIGSNKTGHQDYNAQSFVISNNGNAISKQTVNAARCQGRMLRGVVDYSIGKK